MSEFIIDTKKITDEASFHQVFKDALGFPDFYGRNMDAWIDCMSDFHSEYPMGSTKLTEGELLHLHITDTLDFNKRHPELMKDLIECAGFVNSRYLERGEKPYMSLIFLY